MNATTCIKFITTQSRTKLTAGKTCYQGQLQHNNVLGERETKSLFAEYCGEQQSRTSRYVDALTEFIAQQVAAGYRIDFGGFAVGLKLRSGFKSMNAPFDPTTNSVSVEMIPGKDIVKTSFGSTDFRLIGPIDCGGYWSVLQGRYLDDPALIRVRHRLTVIA